MGIRDTKEQTSDPNFHIQRSYELEAAGLLEESIRALQIALALDAENGEARLNLAVALGRKGQLNEAIAEAVQIPENDSRRYDALALIGTLRRHLGDQQGAERDLQHALNLCTTKPQAFLYLAQLRLLQNRLDEALENALLAKKFVHDGHVLEAELVQAFAGIYRQQGSFSEALQCFDRFLELRPNDLDVRLQRVSLFETMGLTEQALSELQSTIELNPDDQKVLDRVQGLHNSRFERQIQGLRLDYPFSEIESALRKSLFEYFSTEDSTSAERQSDVEDHVFKRYAITKVHYIPWIRRVFDLENSDIIEIGCGSGSSTVAFAGYCRHIHAYEIDHQSVLAAKARLQIMGCQNARVIETKPQNLLKLLKRNHSSGVSAALLFAVLEHMTISERMKTLNEIWKLLKPGGILIIAETPNRLTYYDHHTSWLPFFHFLPLELALQYHSRSTRSEFKERIKWSVEYSPGFLEGVVESIRRMSNAFFRKEIIYLPQMELIRQGTSVSYHEFEIAFGSKLKDLLVADGDAPEMRSISPFSVEEKLLRQYFIEAKIEQPLAFTNRVLNLIFRKPE